MVRWLCQVVSYTVWQKKNNLELPNNYEGYSFHSYETLPLANENLTAAEILKFRDEAFLNIIKILNFSIKLKKYLAKKQLKILKKLTK